MKRFQLGLILLGIVVGCSVEAEPECVGSGGDELRQCAKGTTLKGVDISAYQGTVSWTKIKAAGQSFGFVRVSDGLNTPDTRFAANWPAMKTAGLVRGAYQFFRPSQDANAQADLFISKINAAGGLQPGDLAPVLDLEVTSGRPNAEVVSKAKAWLARVESKLGVKPIIYTGNNMATVTQSHFSAYALWVPNYQATCPLIPSGWKDWAFWQNSETGRVNGVTGNVDTNLFNGTMTQLLAFTKKSAVVTDAGVKDAEADPDLDVGPAPKPSSEDDDDDDVTPQDAKDNDGSEGSTMNDSKASAEDDRPKPSTAVCK